MELYSSESWEYSRNYASLLGEIPSSFTSTIRSLLADFEKNNNTLSSGSRYLATRLVRSSSMKASYYYATEYYKPESFEGKQFITDDDLVKAHKPDEIATLFGIIYLYKKAKKYCDAGEMAHFLPNLHSEICISGQVGVAIPSVGFSAAILTYGLRYIAACTFLRHNIKHFQEYRRLLKNEKTIFSLEKEIEYFGCTIPQIASIFMQTLGFGIPYSNDFAMAMSNETLLAKTSPDSSPFKVAELWTRTLIETKKEPQIIHDSKYYPKNSAIMQNIIAKASAPPVMWLDKTSEDINLELTPKLMSSKAADNSPRVSEEISADLTAQAADLDKIEEEI